MGFDLATAQPVSGGSGGFDISTAQPVASNQQQPQAGNGFIDRTVESAAINDPLKTAGVEMALHAGTGTLAVPLSGIAGIAGSILPGPRGQGANWSEKVGSALTYQPRSPVGVTLVKASDVLPGAISKGAFKAGGAVSDVTGSPALGAATNTAIQMAPSLLLRTRAGKVITDVNRGPNPVPRSVPASEVEAGVQPAKAAGRQAGLESVSKPTPTIEELKAQAKDAYKRAEDAGIKLSEGSFKGLKSQLVRDLGERADPTLHPDTSAALKRILGTKGSVTLEKLDQLRQIANDAKGSPKPADQRLAGRIVDTIDDYVDGLGGKDITSGDVKGAAALKEARELYQRQKKAELIDNLIERAKISAPNFSASGLENALRTEFRSLAKNQKQMKRFTPEERDAIIKVAKGGKMENAARFLGKFAPTGVVSAVLSGGAGAMIGGPLGAALPLAGIAGRTVATRMTLRNANTAGEIMRRGPNALAEKTQKQSKRNALVDF